MEVRLAIVSLAAIHFALVLVGHKFIGSAEGSPRSNVFLFRGISFMWKC